MGNGPEAPASCLPGLFGMKGRVPTLQGAYLAAGQMILSKLVESPEMGELRK